MEIIAEWIPTRFLDKLVFATVGLDTITLLSPMELISYLINRKASLRFLRTEPSNVPHEILADNFEISIFRLIDFTPSIYARIIDNFDDYVVFLKHLIEPKIKNKKVILWYSGGKDSSMALITLLKLKEHVSFDLRIYYIHVPYLDGERNIRFAEWVEDKLSIDINYASIPRSKMLDLLYDFGLPFRGHRWCTYHAKVRIMRSIKRKEKADYEVTSERMFESLKRFQSLMDYLKKQTLISGKQLKPIFYVTLLDIIDVLKKHNIVHPDYLKGCSRVSCSICPYRTLLELEITENDLEDPGLIDDLIKRQYKQYYTNIPWEDYKLYSLWRFSPKQAEVVLKLRKSLGYNEKIDNAELRHILSFPWKNSIDNAPKIALDALRELILNNKSNYGIINLESYSLYF